MGSIPDPNQTVQSRQQEHAWGAYLIQAKQYKGADAGIEELEPVA